MRWISLCVALALLGPAGSALASAPGPINAVVGDASWVARHGRPPTPRDDEAERIRTHLRWVEQRLRARDVSHLPPAQRQRRARLLDALARYTARGQFPKHDKRHDRRPRFIDHQGRICAVGHLVEVSAGRDVAEAISARHEYEYLWRMRSERLARWIARSGLTLRELSMIQPQYGWQPDPDPVAHPVPRPDLEQRLAGAQPAVRRCVRRHVAWAAVTVRAHVTVTPRRRVGVRVDSYPYHPRVEACAARAARRVVSHGARVRRTLEASHTWRIAARRPDPPDRPHTGPPPISEPRVRRMAHGALDPHRHRLEACLDGEPARGTVTLRASVRRDGRLRLDAVRVPAGVARWRLRCIASIVRARRVAARPDRAVSFVYHLAPSRHRWGVVPDHEPRR